MNAYNDASLIMYPSGYKAGKLYSLKPTNGTGDFTVVRNTTATRVDALGLIESVAANVPRIDYTGGGCGSLLVEPAATNLVLRSEEFNDASWAKTRSSISSNATTAPNGTSTADKLIASVDNNTHFILQSSIVVTAQIYSASIFAKKAEYDTLRLRMVNLWSPTPTAVFNLTSKTVVSTTSATASITEYSNGWFRLDLTATINAIAGSNAQLEVLVGNNSAVSFAGDGTSGVFIWGAQLEVGSVATSYIPTVASTQTRNADVISLTSASALIGQTDGTLYAEVDVSKLLGTVVRGMLTISNNTTANRIQIGFTGASANTIRVIYSGASTLNYNFAITTTGIYKIAFAYSASSTAFYVNGSLVSALGGNSFSASVGNVYLGSVFDGTSALNDRISAAALYTFRLSNAELIELTTL